MKTIHFIITVPLGRVKWHGIQGGGGTVFGGGGKGARYFGAGIGGFHKANTFFWQTPNLRV